MLGIILHPAFSCALASVKSPECGIFADGSTLTCTGKICCTYVFNMDIVAYILLRVFVIDFIVAHDNSLGVTVAASVVED